MFLVFALSAVLFAQAPEPVRGKESGGLPEWATSRAVALGTSTDCASTADWKATVAGAEIRVRAHEEILIRGRDLAGAPWRVQANYPGDGGCRFFAHDLDRNGFLDLIFLTANGGSGPAGVTMTVLAFDRSGRPVPWQATAAFAPGRDRIRNVVDLNSDGKAELIVPHIEEYGLTGDESVSLSLYQLLDGSFIQVAGVFADREHPTVRPADARFLNLPDLTNALQQAVRIDEIIAIEPAKSDSCGISGISMTDAGIILNQNKAPSSECEDYLKLRSGRKVTRPLILVVDLPGGSRVIDIDHPSGSELIQRASSLRMVVSFAGRTCEIGCRPFVMWARPR